MAVLFSVRKENGAITAEQDKEVPDMNEDESGPVMGM